MPVYNAQPFLSAALDSVLSQTMGDFELICVNDGSTDGSAAVLAAYAARDPRVVVLDHERGGIVAALNAGLSRATGEFVARMDADDLVRPERFAYQVAFLDDHPDHVAVGSRVLLIDQDANPIGVMPDTKMTHEEIDAAHLHYGWPIVHAAVTFRRQALEAVGGYRTEYQWQEDLDLFLRLAEVGRLANLPDVLFLYRQNFGSICYTRFEEQAVVRRTLYADTARRRSTLGLPLPPTADDPVNGSARYDGTRRPADLHLLWAWWALRERHVHTARLHAWKRLRKVPLSVASWRLAYCAVRGR